MRVVLGKKQNMCNDRFAGLFWFYIKMQLSCIFIFATELHLWYEYLRPVTLLRLKDSGLSYLPFLLARERGNPAAVEPTEAHYEDRTAQGVNR